MPQDYRVSRGGYQIVEWVLHGAKRAKLESWHLWRYNPALAEEGKNPFSLDSKEPNWANFHDLTSSSSVATRQSSSGAWLCSCCSVRSLLGEVRYLSVKKAYPNEAEELHSRPLVAYP